MSIKKAYESLMPKTKKNLPEKKQDVTIDVSVGDILDESVKNQNVGKNSNVIIPDPNPIATKMTTAKTPEGSIWFAINPIEGVVQIFKKTLDEVKGNIHVRVDSFTCKAISNDSEVTILEACYIDGSTEDMSKKDNVSFDAVSKKAS